MSDFDLGTARGRIDLDASGAIKGSKQADSAFKSIDDGAQSASKSSTAVGTALVGFGAAAVLAFGVAVKASADFEKKISEFKSLGDDYANNIDAIREKALQLGADTAFSAGEAADALVELGKQGLSTSDILNGAADATTALAAAGGIDLAEAAGIAAAALNQFKLQAKDLPEVANLLTGAANASATGVHEIGEAFKFVGPVAQAVGLSIKDTAGAIALLANNGLDAGQAGTALRAILTRLQPASKEAAGEMRSLGLITKDGSNQFFDAKGNIKSFADIVDILGKSTSKLTAQQKAQALQTIFGTEALSAANIVAGEGKDAFLELQDAIGKVKAADVAAEKMDNLAGAIDEFQGSVETALIRAGAPFQDGLKKITQLGTGVINMFSNLNPEIQKWIGYAVAAAGVAALLVGGIILLSDAVVKAKAAFAAFNLVLDANPIALVVLAIAAIAAALVVAYNNVQPFRDAVDKLWERMQPLIDTIRNGLGKALEWLSNTAIPFAVTKFNELKDKAIEVAGWVGDKIAGPIDTAWTFIQSKIGGVVDWITGTLVPNIQAAWSKIPEGLGSVVESIENMFGPGASKIWEQLQSGAANLKTWFQTDFAPAIANLFNDKILPAWQTFLAWIDTNVKPKLQELATTVQTTFQTVADTVKGKMTEIAQSAASGDLGSGITEKISTAWNAVISFLTGTILPALQGFIALAIEQWNQLSGWLNTNVMPVITALGELWTAIWNRMLQVAGPILEVIKVVIGVFVGTVIALWNAFGDTILTTMLILWDGIKGATEAALQIIRGIINVLTGIISGDWGKAWEGIVNILQGAWNFIWAIVSTTLELIWNIVQGIMTGIWRLIQMVWGFVTEKTAEAWQRFKDSVMGGINGALEFIGGLYDKIKGILGGIDLFAIGKSIIEGLINGIKSMFGVLTDAFNWITDKIPDWKGPPEKDKKLLIENGQLIMGGLIRGIQDGAAELQSMLNNVAPTISANVAPANAPPPSAAGNMVTVQFNYSGGNPDEFVKTVESSGLIGRITNAARSRRR